MRWIDRGPEPPGVGGYARQFTRDGWTFSGTASVGVPLMPTGGSFAQRWAPVRPTFAGTANAGANQRRKRVVKFCLRRPFQPLSRCPELAYEWTNWVFSCRRCNGENKQDKWPPLGYVDPCASDDQERPEKHFDYDVLTGDIVPHPALRSDAKRKAEGTINDLGLNEIDVRFYRINWSRQFLDDLRLLPGR